MLITGGSGFLGSWACRILSKDYHVSALIRPTSNSSRLFGIDEINIVLEEPSEWPQQILRLKPDILIINDWWGVGNLDRNSMRQYENVDRIYNLAKFAKDGGVKLVIALGSQAELGPVAHEITEQAIDAPTTQYGKAKVQTRLLLENLFEGSETRFIWLRIFSTYGPLDTGKWLIPELVDTLNAQQEMKLTKCEQNWSYLHAYDFAAALILLINERNAHGIIHVGSPQTIPLKTVVKQIAQTLEAEKYLDFGAVPYRPDQVMTLNPLCETLTLLGWKPQVLFDAGIKQTIKWLLGQDANKLDLQSGDSLEFNLPTRA